MVIYDITKLQIQLITIVSVFYYVLNIIFPSGYSEFAASTNRIYPQMAAAAIFCLSIVIVGMDYLRIRNNSIMVCSSAILLMAVIYIAYPLNAVPNLLIVMRS